jgi:nucleoside-diphosphate-sugar epimerase
MKALVIGGSGLLGQALIRLLRWEGHQVVALVAPGECKASLREFDPGVDWIATADLDLVADIDVIFHADPSGIGVAHLRYQREWVVRGQPTARFLYSGVLGPGDVSGSPLGDWVLALMRTGDTSEVRGGTCLVDVRDVAYAMVRAAEKEATGDFVVAGNYVEYAEIRSAMQQFTGRLGEPSGRSDLPSVRPMSSTRAVTELGLRFRPMPETVEDLVGWYHSERARVMVA